MWTGVVMGCVLAVVHSTVTMQLLCPAHTATQRSCMVTVLCTTARTQPCYHAAPLPGSHGHTPASVGSSRVCKVAELEETVSIRLQKQERTEHT